MRCVFCKNDSSTSRSEEHIVPESLGNKTAVLPAGVVCDKCNNYFSRKVERPFLESPALKALRFHQAIPSKRGRVPPTQGLLLPGFSVTMYRHLKGPVVGTLDVEPAAFERLLEQDGGTIVFATDGAPPEDIVVSRFLAKVAIEALADRLRHHPGGIDYLIDEAQFDPIRRHAREGRTPKWPHHVRRIYDADRVVYEEGQAMQTVHEFDLLYTPHNELYLVLAIFGLELAINVAGPDVEGYQQWLCDNQDASSLYVDKNA